MKFLEDAQRASTRKTYDNRWKTWVAWCQKQNLDFEEYNINNILAFLIDNKQFSTQHLNTIRSAIASVFKHIHPNQEPIAYQLLIQEFFSSKRNQPVPVPADHKLKTWDVDVVIQYIKTNLGNN
jgi:hypothetical protein